MRILSSNLVASLAISLLVAACGGGGGGSSSASKPLPAPAPAPVPPGVFDISGTITASGSQASDSDTNDPARAAISNDSFASAQSIPTPITLGGYINQPGTGAEGRSQSSGDINDFY